MAGDIYFENASLLLHMDGSNGSTTFTDSSNYAHTVTPAGNAQISTAQAKFGQSGLFDGNGDYLSIPANSAFDFGAGDFTIECWVYLLTSKTAGGLLNPFFCKDAVTTTRGYLLLQSGGTSGTINIAIFQGSTVYQASSSTIPAINTWYHVAGIRHGNNLHIAINGVIEDTVDVTGVTVNANPTYNQYIGVINNNANDPITTAGYQLHGYIDDFRVTKGIARYTTNFTPPTSAFLDYAGEISGTLSENMTAIDFKAKVYGMNGALLKTEVINNGAYTVTCHTLNPVLMTVHPDIGDIWAASTAYALNDKVFPTDPVATPHYYECTTAGTTGTSEPTWPLSGTVNDGTAVWTYVEELAQPITHGPLIPS